MNTKKQLTPYITRLALVTGAILLIPLIAMQFTGEVTWTLSDFIFAGTLIFGTGLVYKLVTTKSGNHVYKLAVASALATGFLLIWANGAVGIIGSERDPINLLFYGVIFIGIIGAFIFRFRPKGMAFTLATMALGQATVAAIALIGGFYQSPPSSVIQILGVNGFFIVLWCTAALLFRYASETGGDPDLKSAA